MILFSATFLVMDNKSLLTWNRSPRLIRSLCTCSLIQQSNDNLLGIDHLFFCVLLNHLISSPAICLRSYFSSYVNKSCKRASGLDTSDELDSKVINKEQPFDKQSPQLSKVKYSLKWLFRLCRFNKHSCKLSVHITVHCSGKWQRGGVQGRYVQTAFYQQKENTEWQIHKILLA